MAGSSFSGKVAGARRALGDYSAIVKKQETDVWAEDEYGKTIAEGEAGVDDAEVIKSTLNVGGVIKIAKGDYYVSSPLQVPSQTKIIGSGIRNTRIIANANIDAIFINAENYPQYRTIQDLTIDCNYKSNSGVNFSPISELVCKDILKNIYIKNANEYFFNLDRSEESVVDFVFCHRDDGVLKPATWKAPGGSIFIRFLHIRGNIELSAQHAIANYLLCFGIDLDRCNTVYINGYLYQHDDGYILKTIKMVDKINLQGYLDVTRVANLSNALIYSDASISPYSSINQGIKFDNVYLYFGDNMGDIYIFDLKSYSGYPFCIELYNINWYRGSGTTVHYEKPTNEGIIISKSVDPNKKTWIEQQVGHIKTKNYNTTPITADGATTTFYIPHGLIAAPSFVSITPKAGAPKPSEVDWDDTNIILTFTTPPAAGTYYYAWEARV